MNRKVVRILLIGLTLIWMGLIFYFSNQNGTKSALLSRDVTRIVLKIFYPDYMQLNKSEQTALLKSVGLVIRKLAHYGEYVLLALFLYVSISIFTKNQRIRYCLVFVFGVVYAYFDEIHQYFVAGRAFMIQDICIDLAGIGSAILLIYGIRKLKQKKKR
ncbi:MAG: VanZ family protein [Anaeroplasmataceae bacterium]|nr:VanZ family protein [Anaeroplasmataceae bacterium]